ncbi:MAG: DMT family transporter [Erysipelotrichaceae bacterium]
MQTQQKAAAYAIAAALLYALQSPLAKGLLTRIAPTMLAGLLYLGAGLGASILYLFQKHRVPSEEQPLDTQDTPYVIAMIVLDIAAPIFLLLGLTLSNASNTALLNNFEIVATSLIALLLFKERISKQLWIAIALICFSSAILSVRDLTALEFSFGSLFTIIACICWGFENNCTRRMAHKNPMQIVSIKGLGSGFGALAISFALSYSLPSLPYLLGALLLGFVSFGLSIYCYIHAQRILGAARTSAYYALAPFLGVGLSLIIWQEPISSTFLLACLFMALGVYFTQVSHPHIGSLEKETVVKTSAQSN